MMEINHLPSEMLLEVHRRLSPSALKKAVLVNKLWRDVGEDPTLWQWCKVAVYSKEDISNLSVKRFQRIKEIFINPDNWIADDWEALFRAVNQFSSLKKIDGLDQFYSLKNFDELDGLDRRFLEPGLFARSLAKLEEVVVSSCRYDHIEPLFIEMSSITQVKTFHLESDELSQMEPGLFARVLSRLENLQLAVRHVTKDQMETFFREVLNNNSLKRLDLMHCMDKNMWTYLEPGFFARVLSTVEDVSLTDHNDDDRVSRDHMEALITELSVGTQLKKLRLERKVLSRIEPAVLASAFSRLEEVSLIYTRISTDQIQALFTEIALRNQMKKLILMGMGINLSQLHPELFSRVTARLEDLDLYFCIITSDQLLALFTEMSRNNHVKSLNMSGIDLSSVDPEVLAKAVTRLETVTLNHTSITNDQVVSLYSQMSQNTVMKKFCLDYTADISSVDPEVLASALVRLEEVSLSESDITNDQAKAFFIEMSQNNQLKKLDLGVSNFSAVEPEILATAVTSVKEVCLSRSKLSLEQITSIFTQVLEGDKKLKKLSLRGAGGFAARNIPEMVRKVKEKLKGQLVL